MALAADHRPEWLTFDCYGTLIQWGEGLKAVAERVPTSRNVMADPSEIVALYDQHEGELERTAPFKRFREVAPAAFTFMIPWRRSDSQEPSNVDERHPRPE